MPLVSESTASQTAVIGTEHTLAAPTTAKTRVLVVDINALASTDVVTLRIKTKATTGGTERTAYEATFGSASAPGEPIVFSVPVPMLFGGSFTLQQSAGTGRIFPWTVMTLD